MVGSSLIKDCRFIRGREGGVRGWKIDSKHMIICMDNYIIILFMVYTYNYFEVKQALWKAL